MSQAFELDHDECARLLGAGTVGRFVYVTPDGPAIVLLNYRVVGDEVVVRTEAGSGLARWADGAPVCFEVDLVDHERWRGWSVVARGVARVDQQPAGSISHATGPRPWADGERATVVRLAWTELSGLRLGRGWDPFSAMPARTTPL